MRQVFFLISILIFVYSSIGISLGNTENIEIFFQQPTYLLDKEEIGKDTYHCDLLKDECKINFILRQIQEDTFVDIKDTIYTCQWNFGLGKNIGEEQKCNPGTLTYATGTIITSVDVWLKDTEELVFSKSIEILNERGSDEGSEEGGEGGEGEEGGEGGDGEEEGGEGEEEEEFPYEVYHIFQSPTYFIEKNDIFLQNYSCDRNFENCRVNFNLQIDQGGGMKDINSSKYECRWDFGIGQDTGEEQKCNPNTIVYPLGNHQTTYSVWSKDAPELIFQRTLFITNNGYIPPESPSNPNPSPQTPLFIDTPKILIQAGLDEDMKCKNIDCNINLDSSTQTKGVACEWDFGLGIATGEENKCNPSYVRYPLGNFQITLKVYDPNFPTQYKTTSIHISNQEIQKDEPSPIENISMPVESVDDDISYGDTSFLRIVEVFPNPIDTQDNEYITIQNTGRSPVSLLGCQLDDVYDGGSKPFSFPHTLLEPGQTQSWKRTETKLILNNSGYEEVNIICHGNVIDTMYWDFSIPKGLKLTPEIFPEKIEGVKKIKGSEDFEILYKDGSRMDSSGLNINQLLTEAAKLSDIHEKKEAFFEILESTFIQELKEEKAGYIIQGTTLPEIQLKIDIPSHRLYYRISSDNSGKYRQEIPKNIVGEIEIITSFMVGNKKIFTFPTQSYTIDEGKTSTPTATKGVGGTHDELPQAIITLQGKLSKEKILQGNTLICSEVEECSVNLDGRESKGKNLQYFWDFGNGEIYDGPNPPGYWFQRGDYTVRLQVYSGEFLDIAEFYIQVEGKETSSSSSTKSSGNTSSSSTSTSSSSSSDTPFPITYQPFEQSAQKEIIFHIWMSMGLLSLFFVGSLVLLKKQDII